ncbi:MAG: sulfotransferase [Candidatus Brocadiaceae bacterium]|nr:sulfotransferase [Candidatus Brocadiaceae bacterium]
MSIETMDSDKKAHIFLGGLHRSGTSLLHEILRNHPETSGFEGTCAPEDEGQHLQSVYEPAKSFGGPGRFAFEEESFMNETHPLVSEENAEKLFKQWSTHWDLKSTYLIEKSPPNIVRTRFLQALFPNSYFIIILRHPIAVSYATKKWSKTNIKSLIDHSLICYERFFADLPFLKRVFILRYESLCVEPEKTMDAIFGFLGLDPIYINKDVYTNVNAKYFNEWKKDKKKLLMRFSNRIPLPNEHRFCRVGYSLKNLEELKTVSWIGAHGI